MASNADADRKHAVKLFNALSSSSSVGNRSAPADRAEPNAAPSRRVDLLLAGAGVVLLTVAVLIGSPATGLAFLTVATWAAGRVHLDGRLARPGRSGHLAAALAVVAVLIARTMPESVAVAGPLLAVGVAALVTAPATKARVAVAGVVRWAPRLPLRTLSVEAYGCAAVAVMALGLLRFAPFTWAMYLRLLAGPVAFGLVAPGRAAVPPMAAALGVALVARAYSTGEQGPALFVGLALVAGGAWFTARACSGRSACLS